MLEIVMICGAGFGIILGYLAIMLYDKYTDRKKRNKNRAIFKESYPDKKDWYWLKENQPL